MTLYQESITAQLAMDPSLPSNAVNALEVMDGLVTPPEGANIQLPFGYGSNMRDQSETYKSEKRGFSEPTRISKGVHVANFSFQASTVRTPKDDSGITPRVASWRSNVVALSQRFNLYFTTYVDKIHVTKPNGLKHTISGTPDLIIDLPRTDRALKVGGYINQSRPHCVNHLKIGNLGEFEILLMACDDGDVLVYYTHLLQHEVETLLPDQKCPKSNVKPFLLENVGVSAWGLAIHQKSRLIAVGSNLRQVILFLPGYTHPESKPDKPWSRVDSALSFLPESSDSSYRTSSSNNSTLKDRLSNLRVEFSLGAEAHNIPSIDFTSDEAGDAQAILAADINGNLWIINIWDGTKRRIPRITPNRRGFLFLDEADAADPDPAMGWGVLSLPLSYFRTEQTPHEALGTPTMTDFIPRSDERWPPRYFNITPTTSMVNDSNIYHPNHSKAKVRASEIARSLYINNSLIEEAIDDPHIRSRYDKTRFKLMYLLLTTNIEISQYIFASIPRTSLSWIDTRKWLASILEDHPDHPLTVRWVNETWAIMKRARKCEEMDEDIDEVRRYLKVLSDTTEIPRYFRSSKEVVKSIAEWYSETLVPDRTSVILRTWNHDLQLLPSASNQFMSTICRGLVRQTIAPAQQHLAALDRLNMLAIIPELSLVIVGSQLGRAALITLTKLEGWTEAGAVPTCRLDFILPLSKHEHAHRPLAPLLGLAVGPVPKSRTIWRIMLHYLDHSILTYEVSRENRDQLVVF